MAKRIQPIVGTEPKRDTGIPGVTSLKAKTTTGRCSRLTFVSTISKLKRKQIMGELTSRDRTLLITEMAKRQDLKISDQRKQLDSMRSILGHLQAFAKDGWFDVKGDGTHWVMADSILEILAAVEEIVNASKSDDVPFGINRLGNAAIVDLRHKNGSFVPFDGHPLDY